MFWLVGSRSFPRVKGRGKKGGGEERDEGGRKDGHAGIGVGGVAAAEVQ